MATPRKKAAPTKRASTKKPVAKKPTRKKQVVKKTPARKTAVKKPTSKKTLGKKAPPKKTQAKKTSVKKTLVKKPSAKKPARKATSIKSKPTKKIAKPTAAKKSAAKKSAPKKSIIKKAVKKTPKKSSSQTPTIRRSALGFRINEHIVYPAHGVGQVVEIATQKIADIELDLFVVYFEKEKMTLRVPVDKAKDIGMRKLADAKIFAKAMQTLRGRARIKRTMWSRRAQEYEAKINSGDLIAVSEVVRDLFRNEHQPEQSYSERQLYEAALERMAREVAMINKTTEDEAILSLEAVLAKTTGGVRRQPNMIADGASS